MTPPSFNRQVEVTVYGVPEWQYEGTGELVTARFFGDGTTDNFRIRFHCPKHQVSTASPTKIEIYGMSPELRAALRVAGAMVTLRVGHSNTGLANLFSGSLLAAVSNKPQGSPEIITTLYCLASLGLSNRTFVSKTWGAGARIRDIVLELADLLPGTAIDPNRVDNALNDFVLGSQGYSYVGLVTDALNELSRTYGFNWWVDLQVFNALKSTTPPLGRSVVTLSAEEGNLFRLEPQLAAPTQQLQAVNISCLLNPLIVPGGTIEAISVINPSLSAKYTVHSMEHSGDTHAEQWQTDTQTYVVMQGASAGKVNFPTQPG